MTAPAPIPCADCGRPVHDITAKERDRMSDPGRVWCEGCMSAEAQELHQINTTRKAHSRGGTDHDTTRRQSTP